MTQFTLFPESSSPKKISSITQPAGKRVFVIDAYGLIYQVFHALPEMLGRSGESVNAVFGFMRDLFFILEQHHPDLLFCAFDLHAPTFRQTLYPEYKMQREKMPDDLISQIPRIRELLEKMRIPILAQEGFEADDILATVAAQTETLGGDCFLVTSDKDCRQLITDHVFLYSLRRNLYLDREFLLKDWGITPQQVVDYQALVGDSSDNIPGISLIGPKMAKDLLQRFQTLDEILKPENLEAFFGSKPSKRKTNLLEGAEMARLCQKLVRLEKEVPLTIDWSAGDVSQFDYTSAIPIFQEYAFRSLISRANILSQKNFHETSSPPVPSQPSPEPKLRQLDFSHSPEIQLPHFSGNYVPEKHLSPLFLPPALFENASEAFLQSWKEKLEDESTVKVGFDLKHLQRLLMPYRIDLRGAWFDTMIAAYMLQPGAKVGQLQDLYELFPETIPTEVDVTVLQQKAEEVFRNSQKKMAEKNLFGEMTEVKRKKTWKEKKYTPPHPTTFLEFQQPFLENLFPFLKSRLAESHLEEICYQLEFPLISVLAEMEDYGIALDTKRLELLQERFAVKIESLKEKLYAMIPQEENQEEEWNLNSPQQLQKVLFEKLQLSPLRKTKTGASTDAQTLEELAQTHEFPRMLLEYRQLVKLQSTYIEALPKLMDTQTGRIHTTFNQAITATGRLSSSDPNLQNIPVRTDEGREIRNAFVARPESWSFLSADYSQIELRVLAHYCGDAHLCEAFQKDEDIHTRVAGQIFGVDVAHVEKWMRRVAKTVNFGVIYGQSAFGLSKQLSIPQDEAQRFIQTYFMQFPAIPQFLQTVLDSAMEHGFVSTLLGRHRKIQGIRTERKGQLNPAERMAVNTVIQGSAADIIKLAMLKVHERLHRQNLQTRMLLQIHDELVLEVPPEELEVAQEILREEMSQAWQLHVPLKVEQKVMKAWE
ncbi:MAG: DNA polymerase I [Planctomycetia bacterium]|nr:DNA polymerase I [Planctomycetia bacterium]